MSPKKKSPQRQWRRMDLHLHTPASADYKQPDISHLAFLHHAEKKNLDMIAFTDHNSVNGYARFLEELESLEMLERLKRLRDDERKRLAEYRRLRDKILILPGFEFTSTLGFHILGIFPPDTSVRELEHLLLSLRVPADKLDDGSSEVGATVDALTAYRLINEAGGLVIAAHANSSHGVALVGTDFGGQTRIAYTQDPNLHALEVTDLESKSRRRTALFFSGTKADYPRKMHCIQGSDAHRLEFDPRFKNEMGVGDRATEILVEQVSFEALKEILTSKDFARTRPARAVQVDEADPLRAIREQGNTLVLAFHERWKDKRGVAKAVLEDIAAMANTNGGMIYLGLSANVRSPVSGVDRPEQSPGELRGAVSKMIAPALDLQIDSVKSQGKTVLRVIVPRGAQTPYALEGANILVRAENKTRAASRDEVIQLVRESVSVDVGAGRATDVRKAEAVGAEVVPSVEPPHNGVEIVTTEVRKGVQYHSVRDLRNRRVVHNVTRMSARHLWQYAVDEYEKNPVTAEKIRWNGDLGIWRAYTHAGKSRYDLVQRVGDKLFIYYGVTEDGLHGVWRDLVASPASGLIVAPTSAVMQVETPMTAEPKVEQPKEAPEPDVKPEPMRSAEQGSAAATTKSRAQEWREMLDRALADARAAQDVKSADRPERGDESENDVD